MRTGRVLSVALAAAAVVASTVVAAAPAYAVTCPVVAVDGTVTPAPTYGADWSGCDLTGADLAGRSLSGMKLVGANLTGADLSVSTISGTDLTDAVLTGADLTLAYLTRVTLQSTALGSTVLDGVRGNGLTGTPDPGMPSAWSLTQGYLVGPTADLAHARLIGADLAGRDLSLADLSASTLDGSVLSGTDLSGADLTDASVGGVTVSSSTSLADALLLGVRSGAVVGSTSLLPSPWRLAKGHLVGPEADLSYADLTGAQLAGADLSNATFMHAVLDGADLTGATLVDAFGQAASFVGATLDKTDLRGAQLPSSNFSHASVRESAMDVDTVYEYSTVDGTDFTGTTGLGSQADRGMSWATATCPDGQLGVKHLVQSCRGSLDLDLPTAKLTALPPVTAPGSARYVTVSAKVGDGSNGSGIASSRFRWRYQVAGSTAWSGYVYSPLDGSATPSWAVVFDQGRRYCVSVITTDFAGNSPGWSPESCTTVPVDDDRLLASGSWNRDPSYSSSYFWGSRSLSTTKGASLKTRTSLRGTTVAVIATTCSGCGSVAVYVGSTKVGTVSLASATTKYRKVSTITLPASRSGVVSLVVTTSGKKVQLDGVAMLP